MKELKNKIKTETDERGIWKISIFDIFMEKGVLDMKCWDVVDLKRIFIEMFIIIIHVMLNCKSYIIIFKYHALIFFY